jgi:hypothetical protein
MKEQVQALFLARSTLDLFARKKAHPYDKELWDISLEKHNDMLLPIMHVSVAVRRKKWPQGDRITLTSAYVR